MTTDDSAHNPPIEDDASRGPGDESDRTLFHAIFDGAPEAIFLTDARSGVIVDANAAACKLLQLPYGEVRGMHQAQVHPPEIDKLLRDRLGEQAVDSHDDEPVESMVLRADGTQTPVEITTQFVTVRGDLLIQSVFRDITGRKRAEAALRRSEERLRRLVEHLPAGAVFREGEMVFLNATAERILGYSRTDISTVDEWFETVHPDDVAEAREAYEEARRRRFPTARVVPIRRADGEERQFEVAAYRYDQGEVWLLHDVTDRTRALEALRESEERFDFAVRGSADGLWDWRDLDQDAEWFSPRFYELLGYGEGEFEASHSRFVELLHPDDRQRVADAMRAHLERGEPYDVEYRLCTKRERYRWFRARGQAVWNSEGKPVRMAGSLQDIDDRKRGEAEREALIARLQEALAQVKQLSGLLPICANCKKIRNDEGYWARIEDYIREHSQAEFSHGICPDCMTVLYPELGDLGGAKPSQ